MEVQINYVAVLLATLASMFVGFVWYAKPVFGKMWMDLVGLDEKAQQKGATAAIVQALLAGFLTAYVLAHVTYISQSFYGVSYMESALNTAFWLWLGIAATTVVIHNAFEQRRKKLTLLTVANELVTFLSMGFVLGLLPPAF
ncbi:MAG: DUF1761 domain-containing protein [Patescibacteria group bacterium]